MSALKKSLFFVLIFCIVIILFVSCVVTASDSGSSKKSSVVSSSTSSAGGVSSVSSSSSSSSSNSSSSSSSGAFAWKPSDFYPYVSVSASSARSIAMAQAGVDKAGWDSVTTPVGFASLNGCTTGGGNATPVVVTNRSEFVAAVTGDSPKVVYVSGTIDLCVDSNNNPLTEADFIARASSTYSLTEYLANPTGTMETERAKCAAQQKAVVYISIGSNTTIIGLTGAVIKNGNLNISGKSNIIIRNINFQDAYDYFPQWDPTDGSGNWNSQYDLITIQNGATNIWIDHCEFSDGSRTDDTFPIYFGKKYQHHDGVIDITKASDFITISYCYIHDHDKTHLVGSSDSYTADIGKLRITFHNNYFKDVGQRVPRVRYGKIHCFNNYYSVSATPKYTQSYIFGLGVDANIYAEANYFDPGMIQLSYFDKPTQPGYIIDVNNYPSISGIKY